MYSQCPECQTRFRVTAAALRAARGTVRCGRCGSAFDALERLSDSIPPAVPEPQVEPLLFTDEVAASSGPPTDVEYHFSAEDLERVFVEATEWRDTFLSTPVPADAAGEPAGVGAEPPLVVVDEGSGVEDITLEGERLPAEDEAEPLPREIDLDSTDELEILRNVPDSAYPEDEDERDITTEEEALEILEPVAASTAVAGPEPETEPATAEAVATAEVPVAGTPSDADAATASAASELEPVPLSAQRWRSRVAEPEPEPVAERGWHAAAWTAASLLLVLALGAQLVHHYRQDLVRHPQLEQPLRSAYERLGVPLDPNWDLEALELRQWGNDADAASGGEMVVRASLTNRAPFAQPHPVLRLELEDRFGVTVATRDFEPADYLKNPSQAGRLLAPGSSSEAELQLADPGMEAVGYRLDVCLRESAALLRCARGPG